jgi:5-enolpyruvylshikimate-3-phosphate synthase
MMSKLIDMFADSQPISSLNDHRLALNSEVLAYLRQWQADADFHQELSKTERGFISKTSF